MSDMKISYNVIFDSCIFLSGPTENFSEIKMKFTNSLFAQMIQKCFFFLGNK